MNRYIYSILLFVALLTFSCKEEVKLDGVRLSPTSLSILEGTEAQRIYLYLYPSYTTQTNVKWVSEDESIATVDADGFVTPGTPGSTVISVYSGDRQLASCAVTVMPFIHVIGVSLPESITVSMGTTKTLTAEIMPEDASNPAVIWSSTDEGVVKVVNQGNLTPVSEGTATVRATTVDGGFIAECLVTVEPKQLIPVANLLVNPGFEDPDDKTDNLTVDPNPTVGWQQVPADWFTAYYGPDAGLAPAAANRAQMSNFFTTGNGKEMGGIDGICTGNYALRFAMNNANGIYQIVEVEPGATYKVGADIGIIMWNATTMSIRGIDEIKVLSVDGTKKYLGIPIDPSPSFAIPPGGTHDVAIMKGLSGTFTVPDGVTQVRFQVDKRQWASPDAGPLMAVDETIFMKVE